MPSRGLGRGWKFLRVSQAVQASGLFRHCSGEGGVGQEGMQEGVRSVGGGWGVAEALRRVKQAPTSLLIRTRTHPPFPFAPLCSPQWRTGRGRGSARTRPGRSEPSPAGCRRTLCRRGPSRRQRRRHRSWLVSGRCRSCSRGWGNPGAQCTHRFRARAQPCTRTCPDQWESTRSPCSRRCGVVHQEWAGRRGSGLHQVVSTAVASAAAGRCRAGRARPPAGLLGLWECQTGSSPTPALGPAARPPALTMQRRWRCWRRSRCSRLQCTAGSRPGRRDQSRPGCSRSPEMGRWGRPGRSQRRRCRRKSGLPGAARRSRHRCRRRRTG